MKKLLIAVLFAQVTALAQFGHPVPPGFPEPSLPRESELFRVKCKHGDGTNDIIWIHWTTSEHQAYDLARSCCYDRDAKKANIYRNRDEKIGQLVCH